MFGKAQLHLQIRDLLKHARFAQMAVERTDVVADDGMTVELRERFRQQAFDRTGNRLAERIPTGSEAIAHLSPPAHRAAPEELLPCLRPALDFEILAAETRRARLQCRQPPPPTVRAVSRRAVDRFILPSIVLAPPVPEKVLVSASSNL